MRFGGGWVGVCQRRAKAATVGKRAISAPIEACNALLKGMLLLVGALINAFHTVSCYPPKGFI
jgi:hypothetical protein